jgi:hypothetical protein
MAALYAVQHVRRMRGGSQSHLMRASDGNFYIVKFTNNPQCKRILANEFIACRLGLALSLPVPHVAVLEVTEWLIKSTEQLHIDVAGLRAPCPPGLHLGIRYVADPLEDMIFDYLPESMFPKVRNLVDFARVLVLDKWTGNADGRQAVFTKKSKERKYSATFIDQGYCFNAGEWDFPDSPLRGVYARNFVYEHVTGWEHFQPTLALAEAMEPDGLFAATDSLPPEWWREHDTDRSLDTLLATLRDRRAGIRALITAFRQSSRNPFPNWK